MLQHLKVSTRVSLAFGVLIAMIAAIGIVTLTSMAGIQARAATIYADRVVPLQQLKVVADAYALYLERSPAPSESTYWSGQIAGGLSELTLYVKLASTSEFANG